MMTRRARSNLVAGLLLVLVGGWALAAQFAPVLRFWEGLNLTWPAWVIAAGLFLFVFGLLIGEPDMAVPASIVSGIGGILWYQNTTGAWETWAYAWSLIPGFVGVGVIIAGLLDGKPRKAIRDGGWLILISLALFMLFGFFFGAGLIGTYWPVLLIAWGLWLLLQPLLRRR